ncbi:rhodanese-like domain-containing protein [Solicola sp. PLA-1-18]|uniref:rhodanese-like domain-containing protein n=1 Tax=Solicola sp. PLA-1-18 TaxID=3380532 RepID=UPI003B7BDE4E
MGLLDRFTSRSAYRDVDPVGAEELIAAGALLLDVRRDHEWSAGHAPGATHLPLPHVAQRAPELVGGRTVVTVCRSGGRSSVAAGVLAEQGHDVVNLRGGMAAWARTGRPVLTDHGDTGTVV